MLFAAGLGTRLRPLTLETPKPLLTIQGKTLLGRLLDAILPCADRVFINTSWLSEQIYQFIKDNYPQQNIHLLYEGEAPLETAGALYNAVNYAKRYCPHSQLEVKPFVAVNADIYTDYDFSSLKSEVLSKQDLAHLILVDCPTSKQKGDFDLNGNRVSGSMESRGEYTFSGISLIHPQLLSDYKNSQQSLVVKNEIPIVSLTNLLYYASEVGRLSGEHYAGKWYDVGTLEIFKELSS